MNDEFEVSFLMESTKKVSGLMSSFVAMASRERERERADQYVTLIKIGMNDRLWT